MKAPPTPPTNIELWEPQIPWIEQILQAFNDGHTAVVGQAPTGFGKTTCFCRVLKGTLDMEVPTPTVVLAHRHKLIEQISARLQGFGIPHGIIMPGYPYQPWHSIQLSMVQTYSNRLKAGKLKPSEFYIFDEGHHSAANQFDQLFDLAPDAHFLAVTATPERPDKKPLATRKDGKPRFTKLVCGPSPRYLMDTINPMTGQSYLCDVVCYSPQSDLDVSGIEVSKVTGEYNNKKLEAATEKSGIVGSAIKHYLQYCPGEQALAFCVSVKHAKAVAEEFNKAGVPAAAVYGEMTDSQIETIYKSFERGDLKVLASCDLISEGVDMPNVSAIFILRKSRSLIFYLQAVGRGLRSAVGKLRCILFDHVGLIEEFGLPDAARAWSIDGASEAEEKTMKQCQSCFLWIKMAASTCPSCKAPCGSGSGGKGRDFSVDGDGQLSLITSEKLQAKLLAKLAAELKEKERKKRINACATLLELQALAKEYDYKPNWAMIQWNMKVQRFGARRGGKK